MGKSRDEKKAVDKDRALHMKQIHMLLLSSVLFISLFYPFFFQSKKAVICDSFEMFLLV